MRYSVEIRKFFYSQYFFGGLRIAVGVSLPAVLCLIVFHNRELGFTISTGALGACVVDMPGPLKYKHNEMLACSVIGFLAALATGLATPNIFALWLTIVPLTFVLSLIVVYGNRWPQISFATLFMMVMTLEEKFTPLQAFVNAGWILAGGLWYTYWATLVSQWQARRIEQQALAESLFACADYLLARAQFYDLDADLDECYRNLVARQITAVETQETARDIVLRNLPKLRRGKLDPGRTTMYNLFINSVDLHELFVGAHTDYPLVRNTFGGTDLIIFYRDLIRKAAADLEEIGLAVLENRAPHSRISVKAELRAIEYEIELMRKKNFAATNAEAYAAVLATFRRIWSATRLIDRMRRNLSGHADPQQTELKIDKALTRFLQRRRMSPLLIFSNLNMRSPSFRHALRVTIAVAVGFWIGRLLPLTNAYWIVMTTIIILKPGYSLTKQRNAQRIIGTLIGCAASIALIYTVKEPHLLIAIMFGSMVMSYSLLLFNYAASVVFTSSYVLLMFHLLAPGSMRIIGERAIDTVVGCMIAIAASRLFPYWEYRLMGKLVTDMLTSTRKYFEAVWRAGRGMPPPPVPAADGAAVVAGVAAAVEAPVTSLDDDYRYRLARKDVHIAFANLGQAFQRMMIEPKAHQRFVPELNDLLVQTHVLGAQITAAAPLIRSACAADGGLVHDDALQRGLTAVLDNLEKAEAGEPPPADQLEASKQITRDLDAMVVSAEQSDAVGAELTHDLKVLAHQCKQMLASSLLIRKDASVIRLPA
ncbi:putative transmembrane protein [Burkholderia cenocepacia H111]|uniref:FUSC family protein n=1 Tax=Burkholderia cenocepacia TaxID=95486 RepID=UPI00023442CB|nr:FUSC family membrane protein [Burkholderia cenocepacia]CDN59611.1 putative transmembrane protein [Burkholderia cenocepacia H111]